MSSIWPICHYHEPGKAVSFLTEVVGFREAFVIRDDEGDVIHAELAWPGGGRVNIGGTKHTGGVHGETRPGTNAVYAVTRDPDSVAARVREADSGTVISAPADTVFAGGAISVRACTIADPEGTLWTFGTYPGRS